MAQARARVSGRARRATISLFKGKGEPVIWRRTGLGLVMLVMLAAGCTTTGPGGKKSVILIGEAEERDIGAKMAAQIRTEKRIFADRAVTDYVNRTGQKIVRL